MRITMSVVVIAAIVSTIAAADVRRIRQFPESVQGTWAASANDCGASNGEQINISATKYSDAKRTCDIDWVAVTAGAKGSIYSARPRCVNQSNGASLAESALVIRPMDSKGIMVGSTENDLKTYQRCP